MPENDGFTDTLTKEVGGVPVWAIGTSIGAVVLIAAYFLRGKSSGGTQTVYSSDDLQPEATDPTNADWGLPEGPLGDWLRENPGWPGYPVGTTPRGLPAPITNAQWARQAADYMLSIGSDPALVASAFFKYLSSKPLTAAEKAIINRALQIIGIPPEGAMPLLDEPPPTTPPPGGGGTNPPPSTTPARVTGVRVLSPSPRQMTIGWNPVAGATNYQVALVSRAKYFDWAPATTSGGYTVRDLSPGLPVVFAVRARNAAGNGPWSLPLATRTPR